MLLKNLINIIISATKTATTMNASHAMDDDLSDIIIVIPPYIL
jgi:hypothetical protein